MTPQAPPLCQSRNTFGGHARDPGGITVRATKFGTLQIVTFQLIWMWNACVQAHICTSMHIKIYVIVYVIYIKILLLFQNQYKLETIIYNAMHSGYKGTKIIVFS
jgi:hypothetical protein